MKAPPRPGAGQAASRRDPYRRWLVLAGLAFVLFLGFVPARQLMLQRQRINGAQAKLEQLQRENARLRSEVKRLGDPADLELLARERLGLVKPGEQAYLLVPSPTPSVQTGRPPPEHASWWQRLWDDLRGRR